MITNALYVYVVEQVLAAGECVLCREIAPVLPQDQRSAAALRRVERCQIPHRLESEDDSNLFKDFRGYSLFSQHPVTLNIATPRERGWRFHTESDKLSVASPEDTSAKTENDVNEMIENAKFFFNFMLRNESNSADCSLGWLPAMEQLHLMLSQNPSSRTNVRIGDFPTMIISNVNYIIGACFSLSSL